MKMTSPTALSLLSPQPLQIQRREMPKTRKLPPAKRRAVDSGTPFSWQKRWSAPISLCEADAAAQERMLPTRRMKATAMPAHSSAGRLRKKCLARLEVSSPKGKQRRHRNKGGKEARSVRRTGATRTAESWTRVAETASSTCWNLL